MIQRPRILRASKAMRNMVQETILTPYDFIAPLFIVEGKGISEAIPSLKGYFRRSIDLTIIEVKELYELGIQSVLLFAKCPNELKNERASEALNPDGLMQRSIKAIKEAVPEMCIMSDVALDPYSIHGHDGLVKNNKIINDESVKVLSEMALSHAKAGVDMVAPSDMMDGRVLAIRNALENNGHSDTGIMSYSAKYASCFYGPFRDALDSSPGFGDKKTYQMNPANKKAALREILLDVQEGADIVMIKPALSYLDIIRDVSEIVNIPISAYHVSGEYAMIKAAAEKGWINEAQAIMEIFTSIKRAGANLIATYYAKDIAQLIR